MNHHANASEEKVFVSSEPTMDLKVRYFNFKSDSN